MRTYGKELILDIHNCDISKFNRRQLKKFINELCTLIDMKQCKLTWWDYFWWPKFLVDPNPLTYGTSVVQFIMTSNITIHTLDKLGKLYLNIFTCKDFNEKEAEVFTANWFNGQVAKATILERD